MEHDEAIGRLELVSTIGFNGRVPNGLVAHPDKRHLIYPLGCTVVVQDVFSSTQEFLSGHNDNISCLACSPSGKYLASGQVTYMGFKADVIVWQFDQRELYCRLTLHRVKVQAVAFSPSDKYLATLGGKDDNSVVIWDLEKREALCGSPAAMTSAGEVLALCFSKHSDNIFVTGGDLTLRVWELSEKIRKILPTDCNLGQLKRVVNCVEMCNDGDHMYCGTTTGDVLFVNVNTKLLKHFGPQKGKFSQGISTLRVLPSDDILLGTGDGKVSVLSPKTYKTVRSKKLATPISSLTLSGSGNQFYVATVSSLLYSMDYSDLSHEMLGSCHHDTITDVCFPRESSELFITSSHGNVRVWHASSCKELLRITIPNILCNAVEVSPDGHAIITAWADGTIRAFYPESGKPMYTIHNGHGKGVTALAVTSNSRQVVSGGGEGQVRVWDIFKQYQEMRSALKEHKGAISCIKIRRDDQECVSASTDGTCVIWDLVKCIRSQIIFANTLFKAVCYDPEECQVITTGTDRKIGYWETYDGSQIRELDGSSSGSINGLDVWGSRFASGGSDKLIKLWTYNEGEVTHLGVGHSGEILRLKIAPDGEHLVSVSADGSILRWKIPPLPQTMPKENSEAVSSPLAQPPDKQQQPESQQPSRPESQQPSCPESQQPSRPESQELLKNQQLPEEQQPKNSDQHSENQLPPSACE